MSLLRVYSNSIFMIFKMNETDFQLIYNDVLTEMEFCAEIKKFINYWIVSLLFGSGFAWTNGVFQKLSNVADTAINNSWLCEILLEESILEHDLKVKHISFHFCQGFSKLKNDRSDNEKGFLDQLSMGWKVSSDCWIFFIQLKINLDFKHSAQAITYIIKGSYW